MKQDMEQIKSTVFDTEKQFEATAAENGIKEAFLFFADKNAVLNRNNKLHKGKEAIAEYFLKNEQTYSSMLLNWSPDFIDVAESGDLAYSYGSYKFKITDSSGKTSNGSGIFHTVWKKQADATWKYVWD